MELYLDANAHVPMSTETLKVYSEYQNSRAGWGHPLAPSLPSREASSALEEARGKIAFLLGADNPNQIIFTSTCTQACEWAMRIIQNRTNGKLLYSPLEHSAVNSCIPFFNYETDIHQFSISEDGVILTDSSSECDLAICIHVQNEIGTIQPINEIKTKFLFSDMCQTVGKESVCLRDMPVNIAVFGAHKFGGPAGVGFMYLKDTSLWQEFGTGSRYFPDRTGTPDVASIVATSFALEETLEKMPESLLKMKEFQLTLEPRLEELGFQIVGKNARRVPNTTYIKVPNSMAFIYLSELSEKGYYVGMGSACGSIHTGSSLATAALSQEGDGNDFIRISQHGTYGKQEALSLVDELNRIVKQFV